MMKIIIISVVFFFFETRKCIGLYRSLAGQWLYTSLAGQGLYKSLASLTLQFSDHNIIEVLSSCPAELSIISFHSFEAGIAIACSCFK